MSAELVELIVRLGRENRSWGCVRVQGELAKLGIRVGATSVRRVLRPPWPGAGAAWRPDLGRVPESPGQGHLGDGLLHRRHRGVQEVYVLFAIEHSSRRAHLLGVTEHPGNGFVTQVARNLVGDLADTGHQVKFLIRDRDTKFTVSFDEVFRSEGAEIIKAPVRAPRANALAERFVRTTRVEYLDWTLVLGRRHLETVLREYFRHYNEQRPHRGLDLGVPLGGTRPQGPAGFAVERHDVLGGLIHEYGLVAA